ncbi:unnamed protein product [Protopolystoma xenopodis]|uniref:Uncharacterized protein n=1 Tax=Protopolystoma xenopodis TaxID=117903 RepID=A0A3S5A827_9PLAT|nr:unnamed protein product [Protopolystoma xenopodis]
MAITACRPFGRTAGHTGLGGLLAAWIVGRATTTSGRGVSFGVDCLLSGATSKLASSSHHQPQRNLHLSMT